MSACTKRFIEPGMWFWIYKDAGWRSYLCTCYWSKFFFFLPSAQCWCSSVKVSHDRIMILLLVLYFQAWTVNNCCLFILRTYAAWSGFNNRATQYYGKVCLYLSFYCGKNTTEINLEYFRQPWLMKLHSLSFSVHSLNFHSFGDTI